MTATTTNEAIRINWSDGDRPIFVTTRDEDRFIVTAQEAAESMRHHGKVAQFRRELLDIFQLLRKWCVSQKARVKACYFVFRTSGQVIFVVPVSSTCDFDLTDKLTSLDIEIASTFSLLRCDIMQIPGYSAETISTFVDHPSETITIYGDQRRASS